jgi:hypothetical protein
VNRFIFEEALQFFDQFAGRRVTLILLFSQTLQADRFEVARDAGIEEPWRDRFVVLHLLQHLGDGLARKRWPARQRMIQNCP